MIERYLSISGGGVDRAGQTVVTPQVSVQYCEVGIDELAYRQILGQQVAKESGGFTDHAFVDAVPVVFEELHRIRSHLHGVL